MGSYSYISGEKGTKYFSELTDNSQKDNKSNQSEKISLKVSITNIEKEYQYKIQIFTINAETKTPLCEPEICTIDEKEEKVICEKSFLIQYFFELEQKIVIEVLKNKEGVPPAIFPVMTTLGCIVGSRKNTLQKKILGIDETIIIQAVKIEQSEDVLLLKFDINNGDTPINFYKYYNKLYYNLSTSKEKIYKSECLNDMGKFDPVRIPVPLLKDELSLTFFNYQNLSAADVKTNVEELVNQKTFDVEVYKNMKYKCVSSSYLTKDYSFVDYLQAGMQIGLTIAIDFTESNGAPTEATSLHTNNPDTNQYEQAIKICGNILAYYDTDQMFPCYGFGAKIDDKPSPIFNLNFQSDPNIHTIPNIIEEYHKALEKVVLSEPTNFAPIIQATNNMIKEENNNLKYNVLLILTDGKIDDEKETIDELVNGSTLPLSVIIIGIGSADFRKMSVLDADENPLISSTGVKAARDLVQFVPYLKYEKKPQKLAQEVLAEIPKQIMEYYQQNKLEPENLSSS